MSFEHQQDLNNPVSDARLQAIFIAGMSRVYLWMTLGLTLTAAIALFISFIPALWIIIFNPIVFYGMLIGEFIMVIAVSRVITRLSPTVGLALFFVYAAMNGVTLSAIFLIYEVGSIAITFVATAGFFGIMSLIGFVTKEDLSKWGNVLLLALVGLILGSIANLLLASTAFDWFLTYFGLMIFLGLTVYDTQKIKKLTMAAALEGQEQIVSKIGVWGALHLYLDFINLFLRLLRILGRRR